MAEPSATARQHLFVGLLPERAVCDALIAHQRRWYWRRGTRLTRAAKLHLTLCFIGEIGEAHEALVRNVLRGDTVAPFDLLLRTPEAWRNHVAVLQPDEHPALHDLHDRLAARLALAGLCSTPGPWAPHVTLAREAPGAAPPEATAPISWQVTEFALIRSTPRSSADYEIVERYGAHRGA